MKHDSTPGRPLMPPGNPHSGVELRHLRYLVPVVKAGTFTQAAERIFIAQPTLSQQVRRLEQMVGTPLLSRRRDGLYLTAAGSVLLEESRTVLSMFEHGLRRSRQAAGLDRLRLRFVLPPHLPESLAGHAAGWPLFPQELQDFLALATDRRTGAHAEPCARHHPGGDG